MIYKNIRYVISYFLILNKIFLLRSILGAPKFAEQLNSTLLSS
jgi:hypothetical protein